QAQVHPIGHDDGFERFADDEREELARLEPLLAVRRVLRSEVEQDLHIDDARRSGAQLEGLPTDFLFQLFAEVEQSDRGDRRDDERAVVRDEALRSALGLADLHAPVARGELSTLGGGEVLDVAFALTEGRTPVNDGHEGITRYGGER